MTITISEALSLKHEVHRQLTARISGRVAGIESEIREAQLAANEETKSSAGDKYETGRAMAQLEIEKLSGQLAELSKLNKVLQDLVPSGIHHVIQAGSLVTTSQGNFYLSVNGGDATTPHGKVISISMASPLGQLLIGRTVSDRVILNSRSFEITGVF